MAAVSVTSGWPKVFSVGDKFLYIWRITSVDDTDTLATGLSTRIISWAVTFTANPSTQTSGGGNAAQSSGTITFYPSENSSTADVWVLADGS